MISDFSLDCCSGVKESRNLEIIFGALMKCSCRYKHWGFKEENEVRELVGADGIIIHKISRKHYLRSRRTVPFIDLFEGVTFSVEKLLPIKRIIVGPSVNAQEKREKIRAVEILIDQHGIKADVSASEIPYLG